MSEARKRVLITGGAGRIGTALAERLANRYDLRLHDRLAISDPQPGQECITGDISRYDEIAPAMAEVQTVVHLAGEPSTQAPWESVHQANIIGTYNVFESARQAGVERIVFASTNHVMGMYDRDHEWPVYARQPVRPDSLYGVSKAFGETLGRYYYDHYGISVICFRIGWFLPHPTDEIARWMWLSPRDAAQLVWRAIESDVGYGVFYAISGNSGRHWDISDTIEKLGYRPEDDAERHFGSVDAESSEQTRDEG